MSAATAYPMRSKTADLALDGEQNIDARLTALAAIGVLLSRARSKNLRLPCAEHAASMIGAPLRLAS